MIHATVLAAALLHASTMRLQPGWTEVGKARFQTGQSRTFVLTRAAVKCRLHQCEGAVLKLTGDAPAFRVGDGVLLTRHGPRCPFVVTIAYPCVTVSGQCALEGSACLPQ